MSCLTFSVLLFIAPLLAFGHNSDLPSATDASHRQTPEDISHKLNPEQTLAAEHFFSLVEKRLEIIHRVAKCKWNHAADIRDYSREVSLLHLFKEKSKALSLPQAWTRRFLKNILRGASELQKRTIAEWREERRAHFVQVEDLRTELDPELDATTEKLLFAASKIKTLFYTQNIEALTLFFSEKNKHNLFS